MHGRQLLSRPARARPRAEHRSTLSEAAPWRLAGVAQPVVLRALSHGAPGTAAWRVGLRAGRGDDGTHGRLWSRHGCACVHAYKCVHACS